MILPDRLVQAFLQATKANTPFLTEAGARSRLRERTFRPTRFGPPRRLRPDVVIYPLVPFGTAQAVVDGVTDMLVESIRTHGPTVLAGDSAGGQIALSVVLQLRDRNGLTLPRTIAISPALDLSRKNPDIPIVERVREAIAG